MTTGVVFFQHLLRAVYMGKYVFGLGATGKRFTAEAENSDIALSLCLIETGWNRNRIVYLGKADEVEGRLLALPRNELKFIPGERVT